MLTCTPLARSFTDIAVNWIFGVSIDAVEDGNNETKEKFRKCTVNTLADVLTFRLKLQEVVLGVSDRIALSPTVPDWIKRRRKTEKVVRGVELCRVQKQPAKSSSPA